MNKTNLNPIRPLLASILVLLALSNVTLAKKAPYAAAERRLDLPKTTPATVGYAWSSRTDGAVAEQYRPFVKATEIASKAGTSVSDITAGEWRVSEERQNRTLRVTDMKRHLNGLPVYGERIRMIHNRRGDLSRVLASRSPLAVEATLPGFELDQSAALDVVLGWLAASASKLEKQTVQQMYFAGEEGWRAVWVAQIALGGRGGSWHAVVDATSGELLVLRDMRVYADAHAKVFMPDPYTTSGHRWPTIGLLDDDDADSDSLQAQLFDVVLKDLTWKKLPTGSPVDSGWVTTGPYVRTINKSGGPEIDGRAYVEEAGDTMTYNRSQDQFEEVMVYYHIDTVQRRLQALGITDLQAAPLPVDAHYDIVDNSYYDGILNSLSFGTGGVDDAEDGEVIIHEYGHALHFDALYGLSTGGEYDIEMADDISAFSEGFGDYMAVSHSVQVSGVLDSLVFNWDGHNEFWNGRTVVTNQTYEQWNNNDDIYRQGTIFANALWEIFKQLGPEITDNIVVNGLDYHLPTSNIKVVASGMVDAAEDLYPENPEIAATVQNELAAKGFINTVSVEEGSEFGVGLPRSFNLTPAYPNPFNPSTAMVATLTQPSALQLRVYDVLGRLVAQRDYGQLGTGSHRIVWRAANGLASGLYLVRVEAEGAGVKTQRVLLVR